MSNPEYKERTEKYRESRGFGKKIEDQILKKLKAGVERFPDIINCPNENCRNPVKVENEDKIIRLTCGLCGWSKIIKKP